MYFGTKGADTQFSEFITGIEWRVHYHHGVIRGECPTDNVFESQVPNSDGLSGKFFFETGSLAGNQEITITWQKDLTRNVVILYIYEVTPPQ